MQAALAQARRAEAMGDVPIGAVVVRGGRVIAAACNRRIIDRDPTAHAEMLAIRAAAAALGDWRLEGCTLVVTLEPCCMCAGAIVLARVRAAGLRRRRPQGRSGRYPLPTLQRFAPEPPSPNHLRRRGRRVRLAADRVLPKTAALGKK